jgi:membrane protein
MLGQRAAYVLKHPGVFAIQVLKSFRANQGLLLAGALAYYALLSIVPLLILTVIALSHVIDQTELPQTLGRYLEWLIPGQSGVLIVELSNFLDHREVMGWVLLVTMLFFSSLAFTVLENAMSVILHVLEELLWGGIELAGSGRGKWVRGRQGLRRQWPDPRPPNSWCDGHYRRV